MSGFIQVFITINEKEKGNEDYLNWSSRELK